ncbi:glycerophosphodiester phosphodiesterase [Actinomadura rupiterrae]|uniref:glycerophosphodiester phosphodiesterase n=1 Tax=Actinomadura rupiterrae TaxID=559627 RepID=UPI0020A5BD50|nr:glycerophosphodiester phosphodiesterase [Actinomadura rupiterrae]MCP2339472.1 glycerophosphoryl diester phosphodiesterase [Actinomadura rupiterrae]
MIRRARVLAAAAVLAPVAALAAATLPAASPAPGPSAEAAPALTAARGPLILGHRGAPGYRPEHTEGSYELAVRMGADFIEPDLVPTKDGQLVVRHENEIGGTTDVASHPEFANRKTTKTVDGTKITGWFTEDFTLAELKTLRAAERLPDIRQHNTLYNGRYQVLTLQEVIDLAKRFTREYHRKIGIVPETKHPTYFRSIGLPLENTLIATLKRNHFDQGGRTVVQSFEPSSLRILHRALPHVTVLQCISNTGSPYDTTATGSGPTFADMTKPAGLKTVREYADWIGPEKTLVIPPKADGSLGTPGPLVADAHRAGLKVVPYTFRNENQFLPTDLRNGTKPGDYGNVFKEYEAYFKAGIDGMFSDNSDTAYRARQDFLGERS